MLQLPLRVWSSSPARLAVTQRMLSSARCTAIQARNYCTRPPASAEKASIGYEAEDPPEVIPLPNGISNERFGLYELLGTGSANEDGTAGKAAILAVHGPREHWVRDDTVIDGACGGMFAVIATSGTQHKVTAGDVLYTNRLQGDVNTQITFTDVLLVGTMEWSVFGRPMIPNAVVVATVEEQARSGKVMVSKFKKRKGYRRRMGHRQPITRLRIDEIRYELPDKSMIIPHEVEYDPHRPPVRNHPKFI